MKLTKTLFLFLVGFGILLNSCSVEKRKYMDGYHVQWHHKKTQKVEPNIDVAIAEPAVVPAESLPATQPEAAAPTQAPESAIASLDNPNASEHKEHMPATYIAKQGTIKAFQTLKKLAKAKDEPIINERAQNAKYAAYGLLASSVLNVVISSSVVAGSSALGTASTVLGLIAFLCLIMAFVLGYTAKGEFRDNPNYYKNRKDYVFALTVAWVYAILTLLLVLILIFIIVVLLAMI
jgi:hypothetical protein